MSRRFSSIVESEKRESVFDHVLKVLDPGPAALLTRVREHTGDLDEAADELNKCIKEDAVVGILPGFATDTDIRDFYLANASVVDDELASREFFDTPPTEYGTYSLSSMLEYGTAIAIIRWAGIAAVAVRGIS
jgi:hypothetical protein